MRAMVQQIDSFKKLISTSTNLTRITLKEDLLQAATQLSKGDHTQVAMAKELIEVANLINLFHANELERLLEQAIAALNRQKPPVNVSIGKHI